MKKIMLSAIAVIGLTAASQAQFKLGVKASGTLDDQRMNTKGSSIYGSSGLKGYQAGIIADVDLGSNFYLQPQLVYTRKSSIRSKPMHASDVKVRMSYLELPVNVVYKFNLPFGKAFVGAGGALSYGIGGKEEQGGISKKIYAGSQRNWKRDDVSLTFTAGVEFNNGLFASINSQNGLLDVHKAADVSVKNRSFSVSVGYFIDWKKIGKKA